MRRQQRCGLVAVLAAITWVGAACDDGDGGAADGGPDGGVDDGGRRGTGAPTGTFGDAAAGGAGAGGGGGVGAGGAPGGGGSGPIVMDAGADVPAVVSMPLTITRRTAYRRITNFQRGTDAKFMTNARMSANGSTVIFATVAGTYTIASDGSKLVQLSDKRNNGLVDISANGQKVVWYDDTRMGFVANADGSGKVPLPGKGCTGLRMTAAGDQIFEVAPDDGGIVKVAADGSGLKLIMSTADISKLNGLPDANPNHWRGVIDVSDDGGKVVFTWLWDAFAMNGDGTGARALTQFLMPENRTLKNVRVSGNGAKLVYNTEDGVNSAFTISDWAGGNKLEYKGLRYGGALWTHMSGDASRVAASYGVLLLDTTKDAPYDAFDSGSGSIPLGRPVFITTTTDAKRACIVVEGPESTDQGRPHQIVIADFEPATSNGAPTIESPSSTLTMIPNNGSKRASVFAVVKDAEVMEVHSVALRGGWRLALGITPWLNWPLGDTGMNGDLVAKDNTYSNATLHIPTDAMVTPGPFTLRFVASNKANHVLMIDTEGLSAVAP